MRRGRVIGVGAAALALLLPAVAHAGTVTRDAAAITYRADPATGANEEVLIGFEAGQAFVSSDRGVTSTDCRQTAPDRVECEPAPSFVVHFSGFDDRLTADLVGEIATVEAHGGDGADQLAGALKADRLFGDGGPDVLAGAAGADTLNGGDAKDGITGGTGPDQIDAGAGDDTVNARDGEADVIECGIGFDTVSADAQDELRNCENADLDGDASFGTADCAPNDPAVHPGASEVPGNTVDENCDGTAADRDGDGAPAGSDCNDDNAAVGPGEDEVVGNSVDENCDGQVTPLPRVAAGVFARFNVIGAVTRIRKLRVSDLPAGARVTLRCRAPARRAGSVGTSPRRAVCAFRRRTFSYKNGATRVSYRRLFKRRALPRGTIIEIEVAAPGTIGELTRYRVRKRKRPRRTVLCVPPGATAPEKC